MIKISKNIKKFRKMSNLTQEQLAERMNITRQAISNWENDKSQPDINCITQLAEIFNISIEEMVYGNLNKVGYEENTENKISVIKIVLSVIGGLFLFAGLTAMFISFWEDLPDVLQVMLSVVPISAALAFCVFVIRKKKDKTVFKEIAGVVWSIGVFSSVSLINTSLPMDYDFANVYFVTCMLIIPIMFYLNSVSALPIFYIFQNAFSFACYWEGFSDVYICTGSYFVIPLFAVGAFFAYLQKKEVSEARFKFSLWISAIAFIVSIFAIEVLTDEIWEGFSGIILPFIVFLAYCFIGEKKNFYVLPFRIIGVIGVCITSLLFSLYDYWFSVDTFYFGSIICIAVAAVALAISAVFVRKDFKFTVSNIVLCSASALLLFLYVIGVYSEADLEGILLFSGALIGVSQILKGIDKLSLFELNVGIISVFIALGGFAYDWFEFELLTIGILLIAFGIAMFFANWLVSKKKSKEKE